MAEGSKKASAKKEPVSKAPRTRKKATRASKPAHRRDSDDEIRARVLAFGLADAASEGFTEKLLAKAGKQAGLDKQELARLFESGPISLVAFYSKWADEQMKLRLAAMDLKPMKIRERIASAVRQRLAVLAPNKEAARRATALLSLPMHAMLGAKLLYQTVDAMWRAVGDTSTDFNFYTKRGILAGVYASTAIRWFSDASDDANATEEFLAARIENVMQFEKFKAKAKEALANLPNFADWIKQKDKPR